MIQKRVIALALGLAVLAPSMPASAAEEMIGCITHRIEDAYNGEVTENLDCWLVGGDGTLTVTATAPPVLYPQLGTNTDGTECWYWTSAVTRYLILSRDGSTATIGEDLGPAIALETTVSPCEGISGEDLRIVAWDYLRQWLLAEPAIELSPPSSGITGLETYVWAPIPDRIEGTLTSPLGTSLQARAWIDQVVVDWGEVTTAPLILDESQLGQFSAYPGGSASHVYETKTCNEEGRTGCFEDVEGYPLTVSFRWQAAYRVGTNPWIDIGPVTPSATVDYPVDEIISRIESTG